MAEEEAVALPQPAAGAGKGAASVPGLQTVHVGAVSTGGGGSSAGFSPASQAGYGTEDLPRVVMRTTEVDEDSLELLAAFHQHRKREVVDFDALFRHVFLRLQTLEDAMGEPAINHENITVYDRIEHMDTRLSNLMYNVSGKEDDAEPPKSLPRSARSRRSTHKSLPPMPPKAPTPRPPTPQPPTPTPRPPTPAVDVHERARQRWHWAFGRVKFLLHVRRMGKSSQKLPIPDFSINSRLERVEKQIERSLGDQDRSALEDEIDKRVSEAERDFKVKLESLREENRRLRDALSACGDQLAVVSDMVGASQAETAQALDAAMHAGAGRRRKSSVLNLVANASAEAANREFAKPAHPHSFPASSVSAAGVAGAMRVVTKAVREHVGLDRGANRGPSDGDEGDEGSGKGEEGTTSSPDDVEETPGTGDMVATVKHPTAVADEALVATLRDTINHVGKHLATWPGDSDTHEELAMARRASTGQDKPAAPSLGDTAEAAMDEVDRKEYDEERAMLDEAKSRMRKLRHELMETIRMSKEVLNEVSSYQDRHAYAVAAVMGGAGEDDTEGGDVSGDLGASRNKQARADMTPGQLHQQDRDLLEPWGWTWGGRRQVLALEGLTRQIQDVLSLEWPGASMLVAAYGDRLVEDEWGNEVETDAHVIKRTILRRLERLLQATESALLVRAVAEMGATLCLSFGDARVRRVAAHQRHEATHADMNVRTQRVETKVERELHRMSETVEMTGKVTSQTSTTVDSVMRELAQTHTEVRELHESLQGRATKSDLEGALEQVNASIEELEKKNKAESELRVTTDDVERIVVQKQGSSTAPLKASLDRLNDRMSNKAEYTDLKKLQHALRSALKRVKLAELAAAEAQQDPMLADKFKCLSCNRTLAGAFEPEADPKSPTKTLYSASTQPPLYRNATSPPPRTPPPAGRPNTPPPDGTDATVRVGRDKGGSRAGTRGTIRRGRLSTREINTAPPGTPNAWGTAEPSPTPVMRVSMERGPSFQALDMTGRQLRKNVSSNWRDPSQTLPVPGASASAAPPASAGAQREAPGQQKVVVAYQRMMPRKVLRSKHGSRSSSAL